MTDVLRENDEDVRNFNMTMIQTFVARAAKANQYDKLIVELKEVIDGLSKSADDAKSRFDEAHDDLDIEKYAKYGAKMQTYIEIEGVLRRVVEKYEIQ